MFSKYTLIKVLIQHLNFLYYVILIVIVVVIIIVNIILTNECSGGRIDKTFCGINVLEKVYVELEFFYLLCYR